MKVKDFIFNHKDENKTFYLIPNIVVNQSFNTPYYLKGLDVTNKAPIEIEDKNVVKSWIEDDKIIVIWKNI